ncbi:MAG: tRNA pseudouridine(55) synthase TruB [Bacteroidetes bacterium]|nr:tRNA pseudouridine(55) synthase TruB [Bacteroidota bacterium]MDA0972518.1 tRNA pseudouridine(55) synthase TruB [Bacteroidota bacterium]
MIITKTELATFPDLDHAAGSIILVDKPKGWTSFDVVAKVRRMMSRYYKVKRFKVGHTGTLDPLATGLLILCIGRATKRIVEFMDQEKEYKGTITFGQSTASYDLETEVVDTFPTAHLTEEIVTEATKAFTGDFMQLPPVFSAKQVDGKRAYESAREGKEVKVSPAMVNVSQFELTAFRWPEVDFLVRCSKGTYIRSLAHDLGKAVDSGAHLSALRRTASGEFRVQEAVTVEEIRSVLPLDRT